MLTTTEFKQVRLRAVYPWVELFDNSRTLQLLQTTSCFLKASLIWWDRNLRKVNNQQLSDMKSMQGSWPELPILYYWATNNGKQHVQYSWYWMLQLHNWQPQTCAIALWVHWKICSKRKPLLSGLSYFKHASATKRGLMLQQKWSTECVWMYIVCVRVCVCVCASVVH